MEEWRIEKEDPESVLSFISTSCSTSGSKKIICVDYFDTVVTRNVVPEYTKEMACAALSQILKGALSGAQLYQFRRDLELEMTNSNAEEQGELDFSLPDFASRFWLLLQEKISTSFLGAQEDFVTLLLNIEVAVEKSVQTVCPRMLRVLHGLKKKGFTVVLVSDFYLPERYFSEILKALEIEEVFSRIFVSSSRGMGKGSGRIYPHIAEELQCSLDQMVMIGDNLHADIAMARLHGIQTLHVQRQQSDEKGALSSGNAARSVMKAFPAVSHGTARSDDYFSEMASSLWLFTHRLFNELLGQEAKDVFFLSKEGEFLKKLFDQYQKQIFGMELIHSHYLIASRKATFLASLRPLEEEDFLRLLAHYRDISIRDFLQSLNLEREVIDRLCSQLECDSNERFYDLRNRLEFAQLLELPLFREEYERRRMEQRVNFREYLASFKVELTTLYLVDVGWKGSIQDNIFYILDGLTAVQGYFIGSYHATERSEKNRKKGLLFDNYQALSPFYNVYNNNRSLYEMLLGASHGSADSYLTSWQYSRGSGHDHISVYSRIRGGNGDLCVLVLDMPEERKLYESAIRPLQESMLRQFSCITRDFLLAECTVPDAERFARLHARMVFAPSQEEIEFFAKLYHLENFGIFEYTNFQTDMSPKLWQRLRNLKNVLRDPAVLETGIWPPIILQRLGLGFLQWFDGRKRFSREFPGGKKAC